MRKRAGYRAETVSLGALGDQEIMVNEQHPHLGVLMIPREVGDDYAELVGWYWVYHLPSKRICGTVQGEDAYLGYVKALGAVPGFDRPEPGPVALAEALGAIDDFLAQRTPKPRKVKPEVVRLEPVYSPGVTPSRKVRAYDAELASLIGRAMAGGVIDTSESFADSVDRAVAAAQEELLVAEVKQTLANPDEYPQAPYYLVDGTPCNWEGWLVEYRALITTGNDLQVVAVEILDLADELADLERRPTTAERERWRELEARWLALIAEGWRHWGRAVSHLLASGPMRQEQVENKLGYIGNRERGWGALGQKTFLRHPEVAEASKARRMVQLVRDQRRGG